MRHVSTIKKIIDKGEFKEAMSALESLLSLGPNNLEALKLKAMLFHAEGRFIDETKVWEKILNVDREDVDAINYIFKQQNEDREHYYFTDEVPGGGRRYLAYPKALITMSMFGLFGCLAFLSISKLSDQYPWLAEAEVMLANFAAFVMLPWVGIIISYFRSVKSVSILPTGIEITTRVKLLRFQWIDVEKLCIVSNLSDGKLSLSLLVLPKVSAGKLPIVSLDLTDNSSSIRAKTYLMRDISLYSPITLSHISDQDPTIPQGVTTKKY
jgi:hypothetical protein